MAKKYLGVELDERVVDEFTELAAKNSRSVDSEIEAACRNAMNGFRSGKLHLPEKLVKRLA